MYQNLTVNITGKSRREKLEGKEYDVVPAVILAEGVWEGSGGPILYTKEENKKWANSWNHKPVVVYHPTDADGKSLSACDPVILNTRKVGMILNTKCTKEGQLKTEVWVDRVRVKEVDARVSKLITKGDPIESSTGLELDLVKKKGVHNDVEYVGTATNYRPDHLAILPDRKGAFPVTAGGGLFQNEGKDGALTDEEFAAWNSAFTEKQRKRLARTGAAMKDGSFPITDSEDLKNAVRSIDRAKDVPAAKAHIKARATALAITRHLPKSWRGVANESNLFRFDDKLGYLPGRVRAILDRSVRASLAANGMVENADTAGGMSFSQITCQLTDLLADAFGEKGKYWRGYVCDVYADKVIYCDGGTCYMVGYTNGKNGIELVGDPVEVQRVTSYQAVNGTASYVGNQAGGLDVVKEETMPETKAAFDKAAHIKALIGNGYEEDDRKALEAMPDGTLAKLKPITANTGTGTTTNEEKPVVTTQVVNADPVVTKEQAAALTPAQQERLADMQESYEEDRKQLIADITANSSGIYTADDLKDKKNRELKKIAALAKAAGSTVNNEQRQNPGSLPSYLGNGGPVVVTTNEKAPIEGLRVPRQKFDSVFASNGK